MTQKGKREQEREEGLDNTSSIKFNPKAPKSILFTRCELASKVEISPTSTRQKRVVALTIFSIFGGQDEPKERREEPKGKKSESEGEKPKSERTK
uniref:Uncharacterized protein n=1 Tax=Cucumis melo TaxID=3656 RepID=A0A9I9EJ67_CUCME